ncbi:hypothetical protein MM213_13170 [Belliella sp. R4-6]|uniref:Uncharacterized protein n=1 Tax=Belliella alkalica TaxID=1730871 RepID=A0ABS9VF12_9BACT|nr:hypothetical protein [Belliella alkalica]MCH7414443.1 hypothetical protein [Belliella alkalica]
MANEDKNFDELFRNKLSNHEVKPSSLAWERLENKLPKSKKSGYYPFLKIAASIILLMGLGYMGWFLSIDLEPEAPQVAEVTKGQVGEEAEGDFGLENEKVETETAEIAPQVDKTEVISEPIETKKQVEHHKPIVKQEEPNELLAENPKAPQRIEVESLPEIEVPELDLNQSVAINESVEEPEETEVSYKITIVSRGISDSEPEKPGLIDGIENKVEKIGGILSKVDQGFAELQDAKNNLFASITSKKERSK